MSEAAAAAHVAYYCGPAKGFPPFVKTWEQLTPSQKQDWEVFVLAVTDPANGWSDAARIDAGRRAKKHARTASWRGYEAMSINNRRRWDRVLKAVDAVVWVSQ